MLNAGQEPSHEWERADRQQRLEKHGNRADKGHVENTDNCPRQCRSNKGNQREAPNDSYRLFDGRRLLRQTLATRN